MSPVSGLRAARGSQRDSLSRALGRGWEGAPRPSCPHPLPLAENNRSRSPARLPSRREPNFLYLGQGGGLYAKDARPGSLSRLGPGQGRSAAAGPSPSPPRPELRAARSRGDSWAGQSFAAAAGRHPYPRAASGCRGLPLQHPAERREPEGPAAKLQNSGSPRCPSLASLGIAMCFPVLRAGARAAIAAFSTPGRRKASLEQEKDDPWTSQPKAAARVLPY